MKIIRAYSNQTLAQNDLLLVKTAFSAQKIGKLFKAY